VDKLKVGDKVTWRGTWGQERAPQVVTVEGMEITDGPREKYGRDVKEVDWDVVEDNRVIFTLSNGKWAYSEQISHTSH